MKHKLISFILIITLLWQNLLWGGDFLRPRAAREREFVPPQGYTAYIIESVRIDTDGPPYLISAREVNGLHRVSLRFNRGTLDFIAEQLHKNPEELRLEELNEFLQNTTIFVHNSRLYELLQTEEGISALFENSYVLLRSKKGVLLPLSEEDGEAPTVDSFEPVTSFQSFREEKEFYRRRQRSSRTFGWGAVAGEEVMAPALKSLNSVPFLYSAGWSHSGAPSDHVGNLFSFYPGPVPSTIPEILRRIIDTNYDWKGWVDNDTIRAYAQRGHCGYIVLRVDETDPRYAEFVRRLESLGDVDSVPYREDTSRKVLRVMVPGEIIERGDIYTYEAWVKSKWEKIERLAQQFQLQDAQYQTIEDILIQEVREGDEGFETAREVAFDEEDPDEEVLAAVRNNILAEHWWLRPQWRQKGPPKEQIYLAIGEHRIDIYNWSDEPLTDFQISQIEEVLRIFALIAEGKALRDYSYILIDNNQETNPKTGEEMNALASTSDKTITLFPRALRPIEFRIAGVSNLVGTLIHEFSHRLVDVKIKVGDKDIFLINDWRARFGWQFLKTPRRLPGGHITRDQVDNPETCVTDYATSDPSEDICESMVAAIMRPDILADKNSTTAAKLEYLRDRLLRPLNEPRPEIEIKVERFDRHHLTLPRLESPVKFKRTGGLGLIVESEERADEAPPPVACLGTIEQEDKPLLNSILRPRAAEERKKEGKDTLAEVYENNIPTPEGLTNILIEVKQHGGYGDLMRAWILAKEIKKSWPEVDVSLGMNGETYGKFCNIMPELDNTKGMQSIGGITFFNLDMVKNLPAPDVLFAFDGTAPLKIGAKCSYLVKPYYEPKGSYLPSPLAQLFDRILYFGYYDGALGLILDTDLERLREESIHLNREARTKKKRELLEKIFLFKGIVAQPAVIEFLANANWGVSYSFTISGDLIYTYALRTASELNPTFAKGSKAVFLFREKRPQIKDEFSPLARSVGFYTLEIEDINSLTLSRNEPDVTVNLSSLPPEMFNELFALCELPIGTTGAVSLTTAIQLDKIWLYQTPDWFVDFDREISSIADNCLEPEEAEIFKQLIREQEKLENAPTLQRMVNEARILPRVFYDPRVRTIFRKLNQYIIAHRNSLRNVLEIVSTDWSAKKKVDVSSDGRELKALLSAI